MALYNAIRKAASRVVPLVIRASAGSQRYLHNGRSSALVAAVNQPLPRLFPSLLHGYSTKSDESLLRVLVSEVQCAVEFQDEEKDVEVPQGFPFEIEDHPGQRTITLKREYQGETINVEVHTKEKEKENEDEDDEDQSSIPLVVSISKENGPSLEFGCTAYPGKFAIDSMSIKNPETTEEQIAYEEHYFSDLDGNLQKAFYKYLEIRGIKPSTTNFLYGYMTNKDKIEFITWLKNLQRFVEE